MSQESEKLRQLRADLQVCKAREAQARNNYDAACRYHDEDPAFGKTIQARQNRDSLLRISRDASSDRAKAELAVEVEKRIEKRKRQKLKMMEKEISQDRTKARGFRRRGMSFDRER